MRLKVINALHERALEPTRRKFPGQILRRPVIGGRPLAPRHSRIFEHGALTAKTIDELEKFVSLGVIRVVWLGGPRFVDFDALRKQLNFSVESEAPVAHEAPVAALRDTASERMPVAADPEPVRLMHEELLAPAEEPPKLEDVLEGIQPVVTETGPVDGLVSAEEFEVPDNLAERLLRPRIVTNEELRAMLAVLGGVGTGKAKKKLISEIVDAMNDPACDPVTGLRVLAMLSAAEQ